VFAYPPRPYPPSGASVSSTQGPVGQCRGRRRQLDDLGALTDARELFIAVQPKVTRPFPAGQTGGTATTAAQEASAKCSSAADTPAAASRRTMAIRHDREGIPEMNTRPNIVLIHGAWADGSCWSGVIERLQADGYHVTAPQFPLTALAADVARLRQVLDLQDGPAIVAGHSYGGQVMTALGADAPNVAGLVYIAAFGLDQGESLGGLLSQGPVTPALAHLVTDKQGFGWLSEDDFVHHFAADVDPVKAKVMYAVQQPLAASAFGDVMGVPAWKTLPSWYLVATDDQAIPPDAEQQFAARMGATTVEIPSSHVPMISHPGDVAQLIKTAAEAALATS
jgi:pimeloyl-ACP methyl ester carboxylesterase